MQCSSHKTSINSNSDSSSNASTSVNGKPPEHESCSSSPVPGRRRTAKPGDIVTIDFDLIPENGFVPHPLFDTSGVITFVLGWGGYLPGLHALVETMTVGQECRGISVDAGWGERRPDLIVKVAKKKLKAVKDIELIKEGSKLHLEGGIEVNVIEVTDDFIVVDANPPLAGASYSCDLKLLAVDSFPSSKMLYHATSAGLNDHKFHVATFALGCFWGGELAFMRVPGVVGTKVGYTQGTKRNPTYEDVCTGTTKHREAIMVIYDPQRVSYDSLLQVALARLASTTTPFQINLFDDDDTAMHSMQYKHGFYFHSNEQREVALSKLSIDNKYRVELLEATAFYDAENYHQQYLLKGGQSARKGSKETIRCFG